MREIEFRGLTSLDKFVYGGYFYNQELKTHNIVVDSPDSSCETIEVDSVSQFTGCVDKYKKRIYEDDIVIYDKKEYTIKFFPEYGCYGMYDSLRDRPIGRSGSSTKYVPYFMNAYHTKKMVVCNQLKLNYNE